MSRRNNPRPSIYSATTGCRLYYPGAFSNCIPATATKPIPSNACPPLCLATTIWSLTPKDESRFTDPDKNFSGQGSRLNVRGNDVVTVVGLPK